MRRRKYFTEHGINMVSGWILLLQQGHLDEVGPFVERTGASFHIYMICRRPRLTVDPASVQLDSDYLSGTFYAHHGEEVEERGFKIHNLTGSSDLIFSSSYPYTEFSVVDGDAKHISSGVFAHLVLMDGRHTDLVDLEVLYIGQAYGQGGSRTASDRLAGHSTLQRIYSEVMRNTPHQEVWLVLCEFEPLLLSFFDPRADEYETTEDEDKEHTREVLCAGINEHHAINFTEAALIRYFQPRYNSVFKDSFPSQSHSTYAECYKLDLNAICVEVNTEALYCRLWSNSTQKPWIHFARFPLHTREERRSIFDIDWD